jgi:arylsulfatase A-like enzyme
MNRLFLCGLIAGMAMVLSLAADERPSFVVVIADDLAWDDCGAYGNAAVRTPHIDALAKTGMRFDRAYLTCSSCSPSRCSILTGRYPHSTGAGELHLPLPAEQTLLTRPLRDHGYWTAAVGKWHLGEQVADQIDYRQTSSAAAMGDAWVRALRDRPPGKPFFLWAAHTDPHRDYERGAVDPPHDPAAVIVPPYLPDTPEVRQDLAMYYDEISRFDAHLGMLLAELDSQQIADQTLVLVISDNGRPFPYCKTRVQVPGVRTPFIIRWPARVQAGTTSGQLISTLDIAPTVLQLAGLEPLESFQGRSFAPLLWGATIEVRPFAFAEHNWHDYRAFERAVHSQRHCYVRNWLEHTPGTPPADAVTSPTYAEMKALRAAGQLLPAQQECFQTPRSAEFLYDVESDPHCIRNLADQAALQPVLVQMRQALEAWQRETGDAFPGEEQLTPDGFDRDTGRRLIKAAHPSLVK